MSAASKHREVSPHPLSASASKRRPARLSDTQQAPSVLLAERTQRSYPLWFKLLAGGQRLSLAIALVTATGALITYALTVNTNRRLTSATETLGQLQDSQQQLTTANAVFKNHLAQTALSAHHDGKLHPKQVIFLEADDTSANKKASQVLPNRTEQRAGDQKRNFPKGY